VLATNEFVQASLILAEVWQKGMATRLRAGPGNDGCSPRRVKQAWLCSLHAVVCQHFLRRARWNFWKYRSAARQAHIGRVRQIECVVAVQESAKYIRPADYGDDAVARAELAQGRVERSASRIPEQSLGVAGIERQRRDAARQNQPPAT